MKISKRLISIILAILLLAGMTCVAAYAAEGSDGGAGEYSGDGGSGENSGDNGGAGDNNSDDGSVTPDNSVDNSGNGDYSGDNGASSDNGQGSGYADPYYNPGYVDNGGQDDYGNWGSDTDGSQGQGSAGSVSDQTTLFDTSDINNKDLEESAWSDIELDESKVAAGASDFTAMQTDTATEDNGQWMLYLGLALIGLSLLGIVYFIIATMQAKKRNDRRASAERQRRENPRYDSRSSRQPSRTGERASSRSSRERDRYSDGYSSRRRSSRSDTDEIYLPRRVK